MTERERYEYEVYIGLYDTIRRNLRNARRQMPVARKPFVRAAVLAGVDMNTEEIVDSYRDLTDEDFFVAVYLKMTMHVPNQLDVKTYGPGTEQGNFYRINLMQRLMGAEIISL